MGFACLELTRSTTFKTTRKSMTQQPNKQKQPVATTTSETEQLVSLQHAAATCDVLEVTLRSWCKKNHIQWQRVKNGAKTRCLVRISDVRAYLAKRNTFAVSTAGSSPATPPQAEMATASQVPATVPQEPVSGAAPDAPPPASAPAPVPTCATQVESHQNTTETNSATPSLNATAAVPQSTVVAKPAPSPQSASRKQKTKPPRVGSSGLLMRHAKNSMRKFGSDELRKIGAWITQRLAIKFASNNTPTLSEQPTPAS